MSTDGRTGLFPTTVSQPKDISERAVKEYISFVKKKKKKKIDLVYTRFVIRNCHLF